ncbi:MAG: DNA mismatch repair endonuclease MutL [Desulfurobacteriaceae bacterium]
MIKKLPREIVSKIASGQIASSPSNVLKELIENSIDAEATEIRINIDDAFNFKVVDNGVGISYQDLPLAVERFATSKINSLSDLERIGTYGFRGEALYAISQVSHLTIKTRFLYENIGGKLEVKGGKVLSISPIPFSKGTSVSVNSLYFNVPVRRKGFKQKSKKDLIKTAKTFALCNPQISFKIEDEIFPASSFSERIKQLFGDTVSFKKLEGKNFKLFYEEDNERKKVSFIFVNRRPVELKEFEKLMEELRIKNYILFLELEPSLVDVNVSPTKDKVILKDTAIFETIKESLKSEISLPKVFVFREDEKIEYYSPIKLLGTDGTVIVGYDKDYYYFFDQHLIHERVNYEEILKLLYSKKIPLRKLVPPVVLKRKENLANELLKLGASFEKEGNNLIVKAIPEILRVEDLKKLEKGEELESIASLACKRAIKSGFKPLSFDCLEDLFNRYLLCKDREFCPHGRAIYYRIRKTKILGKLGRK